MFTFQSSHLLRTVAAALLFLPAALHAQTASQPADTAVAPPTARRATSPRSPEGAIARAQAAQAAGTLSTATLLQNVAVTGILSDGGTFVGVCTITKFGYDGTNGLVVSGNISGTATLAGGQVQVVNQTFVDVKAPLLETVLGIFTASTQSSRAAAQSLAGQLLNLDLAPINLDAGVAVDIGAIAIDVGSLTGANAILGDLLWTVASLLDPLGFVLGLLMPVLMLVLNLVNSLLGIIL